MAGRRAARGRSAEYSLVFGRTVSLYDSNSHSATVPVPLSPAAQHGVGQWGKCRRRGRAPSFPEAVGTSRAGPQRDGPLWRRGALRAGMGSLWGSWAGLGACGRAAGQSLSEGPWRRLFGALCLRCCVGCWGTFGDPREVEGGVRPIPIFFSQGLSCLTSTPSPLLLQLKGSDLPRAVLVLSGECGGCPSPLSPLVLPCYFSAPLGSVQGPVLWCAEVSTCCPSALLGEAALPVTVITPVRCDYSVELFGLCGGVVRSCCLCGPAGLGVGNAEIG